MIPVVVRANKKETGVMNMNGTETGRMKINIAPSPAPAEIPSSPGSARLFRSIDCNIIPEHDKEAPTSIAFKTLGNLMSISILRLVSLPSEKIFIISPNETDTLPTDKDIKNEIRSMTDSKESMNNFLDNNK